MIINWLIVLLFSFLMLYAAICDLRSMTIPNEISIALCALFAVYALVRGMVFGEVGLHFASGFAVLAVTFAIFAAGWMGGGDAKLMAATALWFGPTVDLISYIAIGSIYGGILTVAILSVRRVVAPVTGVDFIDRLLHPTTGVPYGIALGLAGLTVFLDSAWMDFAVSR